MSDNKCEINSCQKEHVPSYYGEHDPWVICTFCKHIMKVDPMDAMCGVCHQRGTMRNLKGKTAAYLDMVVQEEK